MEKGNRIRPEYSAPVVSKLDDSKYLNGGGLSAQCISGSNPLQSCHTGNSAENSNCFQGFSAATNLEPRPRP